MKHKKEKILFVCHTMRGGGVENVLLNVIRRLLLLNYEITVLLVRKEGDFLQFIPKEVKVKYLSKGNEFYPTNFFLKNINKVIRRFKQGLYFKFPSLIRKWITKEDYDVEVVFFGDLMLLWQKILRNNVKNIGWLHGLLIDEKGGGDASIVEASYKFDQVVCVANAVRGHIITFFPKFSENSTVIYNPINKDEIIAKSIEEIDWNYSYPTFVSIGRLTRLKGYFPMMHIHKRLLKEGYMHEIVIVGTGEDYEEMVRDIHKLEIEKRFHLAGHKQNPYPYLLKSDFFFLYSNTEGYPLAVKEALLLNKPMIVTNVGGIPEIVENEKTAVIIERNDEQMYQAMKKLLTQPLLVDRLVENCKIASHNYNEELIYNKMIKLFR